MNISSISISSRLVREFGRGGREDVPRAVTAAYDRAACGGVCGTEADLLPDPDPLPPPPAAASASPPAITPPPTLALPITVEPLVVVVLLVCVLK